MISRLVPGTSDFCKIVRLTGEGWTGEGCGCALSDSTIPSVIRAAQSTILLNIVSSLFDDLVGAGEQLRRHGETEHPGRLSIDDKLELARLHDRQVRWPHALEDSTGIDTNLTPRIRQVGSIAHKSTDFGKLTACICGGDRMTRR